MPDTRGQHNKQVGAHSAEKPPCSRTRVPAEPRNVDVAESHCDSWIDALGQYASFFEAEISLPVIHWLTNDHVIQELDLKNLGSQILRVRQRSASLGEGSPVMPCPVLCRTEWGAIWSEAFSDAA